MATNLALDDALIQEAVRLGEHKTKREAVTRALKEYVLHLKQQKVKNLFGKIDVSTDYDYKSGRNR